ncbi:MAG TPA: hypothetical protein VGH28_09450 [Polyangiaceae bacterium]|jgi:hypothetical protein
MIKVSIFAASAALVLLGACGGPSTPRDACDDAANAICQKIFQCVDPSVIKSQLGYADESDCEIKFEATANCANLACPPNTTFDSSTAGQCVDDIKSAACVSGAPALPASCNSTCK